MKPILLIVQIIILGLSGISAQIPITGLIGKYSFTGNAKNEVGDYANGLVVGATLTYDRCGLDSSAYHFSSVDDHIAISILNRLVSSDLSISIWAKADFLTSNCMAMLYPDDWNDRCVICAQYTDNPAVVIWDFGDCNNNGRAVVQQLNFSDKWHHYVFMTSQSQNIKSIFMDNVCLSSQSLMGMLINNNKELYIGAGTDWQGGGIGFHGSIDDLRIYDRALTTTEIEGLFVENPCNTGSNTLENYSIPEVTIFPVPANEKIQISGLNKGYLEIINLQGQIIRTTQFSEDNSTIDVSRLPEGVYLIKITTDNRMVMKKLCIKK